MPVDRDKGPSGGARFWIAGLVVVIGLGVVAGWRAWAPPPAPASETPSVTVSAAQPVAPPPPTAPATSPPAAPPAPPQGEGSHPAPPAAETQLMGRLRAIKDKDPAAAIVLAREGNRRFPDSEAAPERASIIVHALAATGQPSQARGEAESMVNHYPDSAWVRDVEAFSGAHRHRNGRVTDAGQLIYE